MYFKNQIKQNIAKPKHLADYISKPLYRDEPHVTDGEHFGYCNTGNHSDNTLVRVI